MISLSVAWAGLRVRVSLSHVQSECMNVMRGGSFFDEAEGCLHEEEEEDVYQRLTLFIPDYLPFQISCVLFITYYLLYSILSSRVNMVSYFKPLLFY